ncbi:hypothetical protein [Glutamicibacter sp. NPDC087344]|uniref:DNA polymerase III subunit beta family protein n=1 Tax=Glutamicibacter sp. NPDC087344 TaxID=3363994 RepID=UPI003825F470
MTTTLERTEATTDDLSRDAKLTLPARELMSMLKKVKVPGRQPAPHLALTALEFQESGFLKAETFDYYTGLCVTRGELADGPTTRRLVQGEFIISTLTTIARGAEKDLEVTLSWTWIEEDRQSRLTMIADGFEIGVPSVLANDSHETVFNDLLKQPVQPRGPRHQINLDVQAFKNVIDQVMHAISKDEALPVLTCVLVEFSNDRITTCATDRYRVARAWVPTRCDFKGKVLIRLSDWKRIRPLLDKPGDMKFTVVSEWERLGNFQQITMRGERFAVSAMGVEGEYPMLGSLLQREGEAHTVVSAASMLRAAEVIGSTLARNIPLQLTSTKDRMALQITGTLDGENATAKSPLIPSDGSEEIRTAFNPTFYGAALKAIHGDKVRISTTENGKPVRLTSAVEPLDQVVLEQLIMPVRMPVNDQ